MSSLVVQVASSYPVFSSICGKITRNITIDTLLIVSFITMTESISYTRFCHIQIISKHLTSYIIFSTILSKNQYSMCSNDKIIF